MLITPEQDKTPQNERANTLQDALGNARQNTMNNEQTTTACCASDLQAPSTNEQMDNDCIAGLACLRTSDKNKYSTMPHQQGQIINPKLCHLNNFAQKKSPRFVKKALFLKKDDDNDVFHQSSLNSSNNINTPSPTSCSPPRCSSLNLEGDLENKQVLIAGRLYLIRQIGNASQSSGSPSSPSRSFTKPFSFSPAGVSSSPTSSSPPKQHSPNSKRKLPVYVRVYKCNKDHFALISRDSSYCNSSRHIYLNMRHCRVMPGNPIGRFIVAGNSDSGSLMEFETPELASLESWLDALHSQTPPESPIRSGIPNNNGSCGNSKSGGCSSSGSPSLPKSPVLPTLAETDED